MFGVSSLPEETRPDDCVENDESMKQKTAHAGTLSCLLGNNETHVKYFWSPPKVSIIF